MDLGGDSRGVTEVVVTNKSVRKEARDGDGSEKSAARATVPGLGLLAKGRAAHSGGAGNGLDRKTPWAPALEGGSVYTAGYLGTQNGKPGFMDFQVTQLLGFVFLASLVKDNHAPDTGMYWYSSLVLGFGIGLLTNSDLIMRLRTK